MKYRLRNNYPTEPELAIPAILKDRGVKDVEEFIRPNKSQELNPYDLENIEAAAQMLLKHLRNNSEIMFVVDCDCDGFTSSAILWLYIKHIFPDAHLNFTVHEHKTHGLEDKIDWLIEDNQVDLVICADAASYDVECHRRLAEINTDVICLDHHEQLFDSNGNPIISTSPNTIIVNNQLSPKYSNKTLCGAGVVYKFCEVLDNILGIQQAYNYIDLAALGEIADVMDRRSIETNYLMLDGLKHIKNKGIIEIIKAQKFSFQEKAEFPYEGITPIDVAFLIAPLINAITRIGSIQEKETMFYAFVEPDRLVPSTKRGAREGDTETAAAQTARVGGNTKSRQNKIKERALDMIDFKIQKNQLDDNNIIFVELDESDNVPQEMTGLIAMDVVSKYHKPCMLGRRNSKNEVQGSIRNDGNFAGLPSFKKFLEDSNLITYAAGHNNACGFGISGNKINSLLNYANTKLNATDFENCYLVDYVLNAQDGINRLLTTIAYSIQYFGNQIDEIELVIKNLPLQNILVMGANKDCLRISYDGINYVKFKDLDFVNDVLNNRMKTLTIYGKASVNVYNGVSSIQVSIKDYELVNDDHKYDF